ncbi:FAD-dependent oxidoreductase [Streptomyces sp. DSM 42041]|uniref:FAD-dependent oxidoreductase n=1 Tax=Streptomyces hazeniae TaxID=3075538 RepID=A0ABU2NM07_9ACTN|nr:FAD-dependent oxidoreductase [Streptomyces sp. DSM 42041]MDT0378014.1 FAD-dependent oxidoreductase [Streptomyces sp. DSM 42041]
MSHAQHPAQHPGPTERTDVVVVGAGPTGLLLAGDLAEAGVDVTLVERRPPGLSNLSRAFGVHARTLEQLDARGLADALVATGSRLTRLRLFRRLDLDLSRLPSRFPFLLITPQYQVERLLERRAAAAGVRFRYGTEAGGLTQDAEGVTVSLGAGGPLRAAYAVGTDGHRSAVRRALGLPFPGRSVIRSLVLADVRLAEEPDDVLTIRGVGDTFAGLVPFGDGWYRIMGWSRHRHVDDDVPLDLEEVREIARRALGTDHGMHDARWLSRFHSDERQAPAYRVGRVLLAGDAAHVHSPAGGQGMNTGLQDAANLGWKLAAVVRGRAPEDLLDTYQAERHPVGRTVLRSSGALVRLAMAHRPATRALRAAVSRLVSAAGPLADRAMGTVSGVGIAYGRERGTHRLTGTRVPDLPLATGRLYEALRGGGFVLVSPGSEGSPAAEEHGVTVVRRGDGAAYGVYGRGLRLLVRPDGYVAWAGGAADETSLRAALHTWTGTPATQTAA